MKAVWGLGLGDGPPSSPLGETKREKKIKTQLEPRVTNYSIQHGNIQKQLSVTRAWMWVNLGVLGKIRQTDGGGGHDIWALCLLRLLYPAASSWEHIIARVPVGWTTCLNQTEPQAVLPDLALTRRLKGRNVIHTDRIQPLYLPASSLEPLTKVLLQLTEAVE